MVIGPVVTAAQSGSNAPVTVTISTDGQTWQYISNSSTIGKLLNEAGVQYGKKDKVYPKLNAKPEQGITIRIVRITEEVITRNEPIKFKTTTKFNPRGSGARSVLRTGVPGKKEIKSLVTYENGVKVRTQVISRKTLRKPVNAIVSVSPAALLASRSGIYVRSLRMVATAYDPGPRSCGSGATGHTANGMHAGRGVVAVDPRVIRLGTHLYISGYGYCVAGDTGGAIKGNRIDLGFPTYGEAARYGRHIVTVFILD